MTTNRTRPSNCTTINQLQEQLFNEGVVSRKLLDAVPNPLLIINERWQVVYANPAVRAMVGPGRKRAVAGLAEGEPFHCVHSRQRNREAGQHESCRICGVARALSLSLRGQSASQDCHLSCDLTGTAGNLDLRVWATPLEFHGERFSILSLVDIGDKRRRELLENTCFHDLLNTLTNIKGLLSIMQDDEVADRGQICRLLERTTQDSIDEIICLRLLDKAAQNDLQVQKVELDSHALVDETCRTLQHHPKAAGKRLRWTDTAAVNFLADPLLLRRILSNMLINALESTPPDGTVRAGCAAEPDGPHFWVHNDQAIPGQIRGQIFQRMTSSKGHGRGIGTYSIKLLGELLGGEVSFVTSDEEGTTFSLRLGRDADGK